MCTPESLEISDLHGQVDFALAYAVLHEAFNPRQFLREMFSGPSLETMHQMGYGLFVGRKQERG